jgi:hypothetical protein
MLVRLLGLVCAALLLTGCAEPPPYTRTMRVFSAYWNNLCRLSIYAARKNGVRPASSMEALA